MDLLRSVMRVEILFEEPTMRTIGQAWTHQLCMATRCSEDADSEKPVMDSQDTPEGFVGMPGYGSAGGSAIATGNALMGTAQTNGNTLTDPFGNSRSLANGISSGYSPSSTSIANSNSQGMNPYAGYGRRKRDSLNESSQLRVDPSTLNDGPMPGNADGAGQLIANSDPSPTERRKRTAGYRLPGYNGGFVNLPVYGSAGGSAITTGNALLGTVLTNGKTSTDASGNSRSYANGISSGNNPSSTVIANSNSQGTNTLVGIARRKRDAPAPSHHAATLEHSLINSSNETIPVGIQSRESRELSPPSVRVALIGISNTKLNASKKTSSGRRQMDLLAAHGSDAQALNNYYDSHADVIWRRFTAAEGVRKFVIEATEEDMQTTGTMEGQLLDDVLEILGTFKESKGGKEMRHKWTDFVVAAKKKTDGP